MNEKRRFNHQHHWVLTEDGYQRRWQTEIKDDGTIVATFGGTEDWSDEGSGRMYLSCSSCLRRRDLTGEIDYR